MEVKCYCNNIDLLIHAFITVSVLVSLMDLKFGVYVPVKMYFCKEKGYFNNLIRTPATGKKLKRKFSSTTWYNYDSDHKIHRFQGKLISPDKTGDLVFLLKCF